MQDNNEQGPTLTGRTVEFFCYFVFAFFFFHLLYFHLFIVHLIWPLVLMFTAI